VVLDSAINLDGLPGFYTVGSMEIAYSPERHEELKRKLGHAISWGLPAEIIGRDKIKRQVPILATDRIYSALYNGPGTLFTVDPNFAAQPGFRLFYIGFAASSIPAGADWVWANGSDATLPAYLDNLIAGQIFLQTSPGLPSRPMSPFTWRLTDHRFLSRLRCSFLEHHVRARRRSSPRHFRRDQPSHLTARVMPGF